MKRQTLTLNQRLAALALVLGTIALLSQPHRGPFVKLDTRDLAMIVEQEVDHVTPSELASWIVEGRSDYRLIDLRSATDYAAYHIPTAENVTVAALPDYPLSRADKVVLYSQGGIHAAQAWFLLQALGHRAGYTVLGGLDGWKDEVLFPSLPADAGVEARARFERAAAVARFFGGRPRTGDTPSAAALAPELPRIAAPSAATAPAVTKPRKKREGC
jgi:hypothetical protein